MKGKASQVAVCAGEGEAVAVSRPSGVRTVCSVGQPYCPLLFCCFDQRSEAQASQDLRPQMASVLIKLTADWISGDIEACMCHHPETPRALGQFLTSGN